MLGRFSFPWEVTIIYIYPDNLKAAPTLWLWRLKDITIGGLLAVLGAILYVYAGSFLIAAIAGMYLFLTIRFDDACILDFIRKAVVYFIAKPQSYRWDRQKTQEVKHHQQDHVQRNEKQKANKGHTHHDERKVHHRAQPHHAPRR